MHIINHVSFVSFHFFEAFNLTFYLKLFFAKQAKLLLIKNHQEKFKSLLEKFSFRTNTIHMCDKAMRHNSKPAPAGNEQAEKKKKKAGGKSIKHIFFRECPLSLSLHSNFVSHRAEKKVNLSGLANRISLMPIYCNVPIKRLFLFTSRTDLLHRQWLCVIVTLICASNSERNVPKNKSFRLMT